VKTTPQNPNRNFLSYTSLALQMIITIVAGTFLGRFIDNKTQSRFPLATLIGALGSIGIALYRVFKSLDTKK
jgi:F0F1-type ATP synthase assembly protein I